MDLSVIKIKDILLVTLPPDPEDATIMTLQENVLQSMEKYSVKALVLDISMVDTIDSYFARLITETAHTVGVMGGLTIIAGMQPSVAITTIQLGLDLSTVLTTLTVDRALTMIENKELEKNVNEHFV